MKTYREFMLETAKEVKHLRASEIPAHVKTVVVQVHKTMQKHKVEDGRVHVQRHPDGHHEVHAEIGHAAHDERVIDDLEKHSIPASHVKPEHVVHVQPYTRYKDAPPHPIKMKSPQ